MSTELHPDYPLVTGDYQLTKGWRINLPQEFNRRIEEGSLVLWRPELTFWVNVWNNEGDVTVDEVLTRLLAAASPDRRDEKIDTSAPTLRLTYELAEDDTERDESTGQSINGFVICPSGYVQISAYYDSPQARALAYDTIGSIRADA